MTKGQVQSLLNALEDLSARLTKVEAVRAVKKSITGQETDGDNKEKRWPSIDIQTE